VGVDGRFLVTVEASVGAGDSTRLRVCEEFGRMTNSLSCPANAGRWIADRYERTPAGLIGKSTQHLVGVQERWEEKELPAEFTAAAFLFPAISSLDRVQNDDPYMHTTLRRGDDSPSPN
jgi:hypothetical protein